MCVFTNVHVYIHTYTYILSEGLVIPKSPNPYIRIHVPIIVIRIHVIYLETQMYVYTYMYKLGSGLEINFLKIVFFWLENQEKKISIRQSDPPSSPHRFCLAITLLMKFLPKVCVFVCVCVCACVCNSNVSIVSSLFCRSLL